MQKSARLSTFSKTMLYLQFLSSNVVMIEPAPFDILFFVTLFVFLKSGYVCINPKLKYMVWPLLGLLVMSLISFTAVDDGVRATIFLGTTFYLILLSIFIASIRPELMMEVIYHIFTACALSAVLFTIIALAGFYHPLPFSWIVTYGGEGGGRLQGFFKDPNVYGPTVAFSALYIFHLLNHRHNNWLSFFLHLTSFAVLAMGVFLSYSRAAWAGFIIAIVIYFARMLAHRQLKLTLTQLTMYVLMPVVAIIGCIAFFSHPENSALFFERAKVMEDYDQDRFMVHEILIDKSIAKPTGIGPGQTESFLSSYGDRFASGASHSSYIRIWVENGLLALVCYVFFLAATLIAGINISLKRWQYTELSVVPTAVLFSYILTGFVVDTVHWRQFWICCGMIWGLRMLYATLNRWI